MDTTTTTLIGNVTRYLNGLSATLRELSNQVCALFSAWEASGTSSSKLTSVSTTLDPLQPRTISSRTQCSHTAGELYGSPRLESTARSVRVRDCIHSRVGRKWRCNW